MAFAEALVRFGVPEEVLTDIGGDRDGSGGGIFSALGGGVASGD